MSLNLATILAESAVRHADRTAVVLGEQRISYAQLWAHSRQYAQVLSEHGILGRKAALGLEGHAKQLQQE